MLPFEAIGSVSTYDSQVTFYLVISEKFEEPLSFLAVTAVHLKIISAGFVDPEHGDVNRPT